MNKFINSLKTNVRQASFWVSIISFLALATSIVTSQVYGVDLLSGKDGVVAGFTQSVLMLLTAFGVINNHGAEKPSTEEVIEAASEVINDAQDLHKELEKQTAKRPIKLLPKK